MSFLQYYSMNKINNILEALEEIKNGEILTSDGTNVFYLKDDKIRIKSNNAYYNLTFEDFIKLYKKVVFTYYKNDNVIDEDKDEAYYRYYKK